MRKKAFANAYDLLMILFFAAAACILIFFVSPRGETRTVTFTVAVTEGDALSFSPSDTAVVTDGGVLGTVVTSGDGYVEFMTEAEYHHGMYFSENVLLRDGDKYELSCGEKKLTGILHRITEVANEK